MSTLPLDEELLPVRMLSQFSYCPRLFYLMYVDRLWADNEYTVEGRHVHRRVDRAIDGVLGKLEEDSGSEAEKSGCSTLQEEQEDAAPDIGRSVSLSSSELGLTGKLDLVAVEGEEAVPVETKRGKVPANEERSYEPERVQVMAQALLLRDAGYQVSKGVIYYAGSRTRVDILLDDALERRTLELLDQAKQVASQTRLPRPLEDSPKCHGCSLSGICLPDETRALTDPEPTADEREIRRLYPARIDAQPLYIEEQGATVGKEGSALIIRKQGEKLGRVRLKDLDQLILCGRVGITSPAVQVCAEAGIPIVYMSSGHWFYGVTTGITLRNAFDRAAQFRIADDTSACLEISRAFVEAKCANQRTMIRRNGEGSRAQVLRRMKQLTSRLELAQDVDTLRGVEGSVARLYFGSFSSMLKPPSDSLDFDMEGRNRRPPEDPVNTLLSFAYAMLTKECTVALLGAGLDPFWGVFHAPRHGRPALALDLMEEFRPILADSAVITAINTGAIRRRDFVIGKTGCALKQPGKKRFIKVYVARMSQLVTHPLFGYRCTWRQIIRVQARLLARRFRGDLPKYQGMTTR